jgi:hypothetical protein
MKKTYPTVQQIAQISTNYDGEAGIIVSYILSMPDDTYAVIQTPGSYVEKNESLAYLLGCYISADSTIDWFDTDVLDEFVDSPDSDNCYSSILIALLKYRCKH